MTSSATPAEPGTGSGSGLVLVEPVRQRLVQVASEVLGRLPAEEVPPSLRAVAKFTPAKRHRLGAVAIAGALDADPAFRSKVAETIAEASRDLVEGMREGRVLHASDPLDAAVVAYLVRPDGWEAAVTEASQRWMRERVPREAAVEEGARLRGELADLRAQLKAAHAQRRETQRSDAVRPEDSAGSAAIAEVAAVRKVLRARTGELRAAQRERDEALAAAEAARAELEAQAAASGSELRRLRARIGELEKAGKAVRRSSRTDRDFDDARLHTLLDTLTEAAAGVRRELSLPASSLRPADLIAATTETGGSRRAADDAAALDRLLSMPQVHLIIDGYNVTKTGYRDLPLADQRTRLASALAALHARSPVEITIAFDGAARPAAQARSPRGVRVLFSAEDELADDLIRRLVAAEPPGRPVVVVTSDQEIVTDVRARGAWTASSGTLLGLLG